MHLAALCPRAIDLMLEPEVVSYLGGSNWRRFGSRFTRKFDKVGKVRILMCVRDGNF